MERGRIALEEKYVSVSRRGGARQTAPRGEPSRPQRRGGPPKKGGRTKSLFWGFYKFLVFLSAVIVAVYVGWTLTIKPPPIQTPDPAPVVNGGQEDGSGETDASTPQGPQRRELVYNFVLLGKDVDSGNTDSIIVVSFDIPNRTVGMISIPRDTAVERTWRKNPKINGAYYGAGPDVLKEEIEHTFGIPIDYYVLVDLEGFIALVDELGGVELNIPLDMNYDDPYQNLHIHFTKGVHQVDGQGAMEAVRYRHDNEDSPNYRANQWYSDVQRGEMQRQLLTQLAKKVISWNSVTKVTEFIKIFQTYVKTDLELDEMIYFATQALQVDMSTGIRQGTLKGDGTKTYKGYPYCFLYQAEDILPTLNELVNPYDTPLTEEDLHLPQA